MKRIIHILGAVLLLAVSTGAAAVAQEYEGLDQGFRTAEAGLKDEEAMAGAELWYKATAGTARFTTYVFQQRMGVLIDWYRVLRADQRDDRFQVWGLMNDPGCCVPGTANCKATSMEETYGFDYCPGDDQLLKHVGKTGYRDPGCDFKDPGGRGNKQDPCDLEFGTSTGALGFRKFPNPRFDPEKWRKVNKDYGGQLGTWNGYRERVPSAKGSTMMVSRLADPSIEPPFLIGMACGACHIAFNPLQPPEDPNHPKWENLKLLIGNQYLRSSEIMASGMPVDSPEWQLFSHERPGTVDTSAIPNDLVHNPGTMNAIISLASRPSHFKEKVGKWRVVESCPPGDDKCWCEPGKPGKCRRWTVEDEDIFHILKGGEDSVGAPEAIQRVYFNIGSCSEECWLNHLTDLRQLDPTQRNFGQTPFDIGQCRRDCAGFRAIEDRLGFIHKFFLASKPADLWEARKLEDPGDLVELLEAEPGVGKGGVARGKRVFIKECAQCHSSQSQASLTENTDFLAVNRAGHRIDWMGNDEVKEVSEVGTYRCRSLHQNHMEGHVWEQYGSETYRNRPAVANIEDMADGGRGYYRNISLINAWAHAPFLHNNAIGPEICGKPSSREDDQGLDKYLYRSPAVKLGKQGAQTTYTKVNPKDDDCEPYDPSVEGRYKLFKASLAELLNPQQRQDKVSLLDHDIRIDFGLRTFRGHDIRSFKLSVPKGLPAGRLVSLDFKPFVGDMVLAKTNRPELVRRLTERLGSPDAVRKHIKWLNHMRRRIVLKALFTQNLRLDPAVAQVLFDVYDTCTADVENAGHPFGESLSTEDKAALTAFLATL